MNETDLILKLNEELEQLKHSLSSLSESKDIYNDYIKKCEIILGNGHDIKGNLDYISQINLDSMFNEIGEKDLNFLKKLKMYQFLSKNESYIWNNEQQQETVEIFKYIKEIFAIKKENLTEIENQLNMDLITLQNVIDKLKNNNIDKECYEYLYRYLQRDEENLENNLDLFISLSSKYINSVTIGQELDEEIEEDVIEEVTITNLELEKVKEIFSKYGYDFLDFSDESTKTLPLKIDNKSVSPREYILKLSKYDNLDAILKLLQDNDIKLDIKKYGSQLSIIFTLSDSNIVNSIISNIKKDLVEGSEYTFDEIFNYFIKKPSIFVRGKKHCGPRDSKIHPPGLPGPVNEKNIVTGVFDNYVENRKLFLELGVDIISAFIKCSHIFDRSNKTVKKNVEILKSYGINEEQFINSLSCLSCDNYRLAFVIDRFIELGSFNLGLEGYNHLKNNLTRVCRDTTPLLYKLINASLDGKSIDDLIQIHSKGKKYMALYTKNMDNYPEDSIYVSGEKVELKTFDAKNSDVENIDFENTKVKEHSNLFNNYFVRELEKFKENELCYNFNGVVISRNKVLRNINILLRHGKVNSTNVLYAITKDSILTKEQCGLILSCLYHILENNSMNNYGGQRR